MAYSLEKHLAEDVRRSTREALKKLLPTTDLVDLDNPGVLDDIESRAEKGKRLVEEYQRGLIPRSTVLEFFFSGKDLNYFHYLWENAWNTD